MGQLNNLDWEHVDIAAVIAGVRGNGVLTGLAVSESTTPAMTVLVASGDCKISNVVYTESSGQNLNISNGDATHPRKDIVVYDATAGNPAIVEGTPAAAPVSPDIPSGDIYLAMVHVAANETTSVVNADIDEGRVYAQDFHGDSHLGGGVDEIACYDPYILDVLHNNSTLKYVSGASWIKYKEIKIDDCPDTITIKYTVQDNTSTVTSYTNIYRNGGIVGTQKSWKLNAASSYTQTISGWSDGDLLQLYAYESAASNFRVSNLQILGQNITIPKHVENLTNQDP